MTHDEIEKLAEAIDSFEKGNAAMRAKADEIARKLSITSIDDHPFVVVKMHEGRVIGALHVVAHDGDKTSFNFSGQTPGECMQYSIERAKRICAEFPDMDLKPMGKVEFWRSQEENLRAALTAFDEHIASAKQRLAEARAAQ